MRSEELEAAVTHSQAHGRLESAQPKSFLRYVLRDGGGQTTVITFKNDPSNHSTEGYNCLARGRGYGFLCAGDSAGRGNCVTFPSTLAQHQLPRATRRSASWPAEPQTVRAGGLRAIHLTIGYKLGARGLEAGGMSQLTGQVWNPGSWAPIPGSLHDPVWDPDGWQAAHVFWDEQNQEAGTELV